MVFKSFRAVEIAVRAGGHFADADLGTQLIRKASDKTTGLHTDPQQIDTERDALPHLFPSMVGSHNNPYSLCTVKINVTGVAQEMFILARRPLRIVVSRLRL